MSIIDRMLAAIESLLHWSMEDPQDPEKAFAAKIDEFETTVKEGREQVAAFAAAVHCQQGELEQLEREARESGSPRPDIAERIAEKRRQIAENRSTYEELQRTVKGLEGQLDDARRKQETLRLEGFLKGRDSNE